MSTAATPINSATEFLKFICLACGYIYDEALGDPDGGLPPGTRYADIPDDWMCPICGVGKADFAPFDEDAIAATAVASNTTGAGHRVPARQRPKQRPLVIVGAGIAGWSVAEAVRKLQADRPIVIVTACAGDIYYKPQLSVALAQGKSVASLSTETGVDAARRLRLQLRTNTWLISIDRHRRQLRTTCGSIHYEQLVLALGASPASLPLDEASTRLLWRINHLQHYQAFRTQLGDAPQRIAVIGAGLVGCELADDLASAGHTVTLLDRAERPLASFAPPEKSLELAAAFSANGIGFIGNTTVEKVVKTPQGLRLTLASGGQIECDIALSATGLRTDLRIARAARLNCDQSIAVDAKTMATADPNIFALGDCASINAQTYRYIEPIRRQAKVLASSLAGHACAGFDTRPPLIRVKTRSLPLTF